MAEGDSAIHAAGCLQFAFAAVESLFHLTEVAYSVVYRPVSGLLTMYFKKCFIVSHGEVCLVVTLHAGNLCAELIYLLLLQHLLVFDRYYLDKILNIAVPVVKHCARQPAAGVEVVQAD